MMRDKRGLDVYMIVGLIVLIGLAALVLWFYFGGFQRGQDIIDTLPEALSLKLQSCQSSAVLNNAVAFCGFGTAPIEVGGIREDIYVNCEYPGAAFKQGMDEIPVKPTCPAASTNEFCKNKRTDPAFKGAYINDYWCREYDGEVLADDELYKKPAGSGEGEDEEPAPEGKITTTCISLGDATEAEWVLDSALASAQVSCSEIFTRDDYTFTDDQGTGYTCCIVG